MIRNFSIPQIQNMIRADVFLRILLRFLSVRLRRLSEFSRGAFLAAAGGENGSHYFKNTGHFRKRQARGSRLASLGGHFVLNFGGKNELAVSQNMVRADVFQKCCHFWVIVFGKQIFGLIQG